MLMSVGLTTACAMSAPPQRSQFIVENFPPIVFFEWDSAQVDERTARALKDYSSYALRQTRIDVIGHTDRSGTPRYNQRLSEQRARAVAAELVRLGIDPAAIVTGAFGEMRPLVPTPDGAVEPQNRRVEVIAR